MNVTREIIIYYYVTSVNRISSVNRIGLLIGLNIIFEVNQKIIVFIIINIIIFEVASTNYELISVCDSRTEVTINLLYRRM